MYINIHSHFPPLNKEWVLQNIFNDFDRQELPQYFSAGLHPWHLNLQYHNDLNKLKMLAGSPGLLAIGECGLDKICQTNFDLQLNVFEQQVLLSNSINKPLIIHCVKAYDEVQQVMEKAKNKMPVMFHGYNKSKELALQLTRKGHYLSFGMAIQKQEIRSYLPGLPISQICLETDDENVSIEYVYSSAAESLDVSVDQLISQMQKNVETFLSVNL